MKKVTIPQAKRTLNNVIPHAIQAVENTRNETLSLESVEEAINIYEKYYNTYSHLSNVSSIKPLLESLKMAIDDLKFNYRMRS